MQVLLQQTTKKREKGKEMNDWITDFEKKFMAIFIDSGYQMLPTTDKSGYNSDEDYEYSIRVSDRLIKFYALYRDRSMVIESNKEW
jgi:hypothetical protein